MSHQDHKVQEESGAAFSLFAVLLAAVLLVAAGALLTFFFRGKVDVVVAKRAIPPLTRITEDDLSLESRYSQGLDGEAAGVEDFIGKYSSGELAAGQDVGADAVFEVSSGGLGAVRFQLHPDRVEALGLEPGERVRLWLSPTDRTGELLTLPARLLQVPESESVDDQTYVVGLSSGAAERLVTRLGRSRLLMTRLG